jgi:hypothetical protein
MRSEACPHPGLTTARSRPTSAPWTATGKPLRFELVKGAIKVELATPVPKGGARRIRIFKTYADAKSYYPEGDRIVFDRVVETHTDAERYFVKDGELVTARSAGPGTSWSFRPVGCSPR